MEGALGRREPTDFVHVERFRLVLLQPVTVPIVERELFVPNYRNSYRPWYDQGQEGACVGFSCSWMMSILNRKRYNARWLYHEAQLIDEWTDTPPEQGSSVRAGFDILREHGHRRMWSIFSQPLFFAHGIEANRWATTVDELRTSIALGSPGVLGVNWYSNFDTPQVRQSGSKTEFWIGESSNLGSVRGGHAICFYGASDRRDALKLINSWGPAYPDVWCPYEVVQRLLNENGEAGTVTDR